MSSAAAAAKAAVLMQRLRSAGTPASARDVLLRIQNTATPLDFVPANTSVESPLLVGAGA